MGRRVPVSSQAAPASKKKAPAHASQGHRQRETQLHVVDERDAQLQAAEADVGTAELAVGPAPQRERPTDDEVLGLIPRAAGGDEAPGKRVALPDVLVTPDVGNDGLVRQVPDGGLGAETAAPAGDRSRGPEHRVVAHQRRARNEVDPRCRAPGRLEVAGDNALLRRLFADDQHIERPLDAPETTERPLQRQARTAIDLADVL